MSFPTNPNIVLLLYHRCSPWYENSPNLQNINYSPVLLTNPQSELHYTNVTLRRQVDSLRSVETEDSSILLRDQLYIKKERGGIVDRSFFLLTG